MQLLFMTVLVLIYRSLGVHLFLLYHWDVAVTHLPWIPAYVWIWSQFLMLGNTADVLTVASQSKPELRRELSYLFLGMPCSSLCLLWQIPGSCLCAATQNHFVLCSPSCFHTLHVLSNIHIIYAPFPHTVCARFGKSHKDDTISFMIAALLSILHYSLFL